MVSSGPSSSGPTGSAISGEAGPATSDEATITSGQPDAEQVTPKVARGLPLRAVAAIGVLCVFVGSVASYVLIKTGGETTARSEHAVEKAPISATCAPYLAATDSTLASLDSELALVRQIPQGRDSVMLRQSAMSANSATLALADRARSSAAQASAADCSEVMNAVGDVWAAGNDAQGASRQLMTLAVGIYSPNSLEAFNHAVAVWDTSYAQYRVRSAQLAERMQSAS